MATMDDIHGLGVWADTQNQAWADADLSWANYADYTGRDYYSIDYPSKADFVEAFQNDYRVAVNQYNNYDEFGNVISGHSMRPHIVNATQITRVNGTVVYRNVSGYLYNPGSGVQEPFKWANIRSSKMFFIGF